MSNYAAMTTPELITEWERLRQIKIVKCQNCQHSNPPSRLGDSCGNCGYRLNTKWHCPQVADAKTVAEINSILTERCEDAGILLDPPSSNDGDYVFIYTKITRMEHGGVYLIDEISMNGADALGSLNDALAGDFGKRFAPIPGKGYIPAHPDFYCIAGDNSDTGANAQYSARNVLDGATMDRFVTIDWPIDPEIERLCAGRHLDWLYAVRAIRAFIGKNDIQHVGATVRAVIAGREALDRTKLPRMRILESTCRKGLLRDNWEQILRLPEVATFLKG